MKKMILLLISMLLTTHTFGEVYKCNVKGNIAYQATPCLQAKESTKIKISISKIDKRPISIKNCESECESHDYICRSSLSNGNYNFDGGINYCKSVLNQ